MAFGSELSSQQIIRAKYARPGTLWLHRNSEIDACSLFARPFLLRKSTPLLPQQWQKTELLLRHAFPPCCAKEGFPFHSTLRRFLSVFQQKGTDTTMQPNGLHSPSNQAEGRQKSARKWPLSAALVSLELPEQQHSQLGKAPKSHIVATTPRGSHLC